MRQSNDREFSLCLGFRRPPASCNDRGPGMGATGKRGTTVGCASAAGLGVAGAVSTVGVNRSASSCAMVGATEGALGAGTLHAASNA